MLTLFLLPEVFQFWLPSLILDFTAMTTAVPVIWNYMGIVKSLAHNGETYITGYFILLHIHSEP